MQWEVLGVRPSMQAGQSHPRPIPLPPFAARTELFHEQVQLRLYRCQRRDFDRAGHAKYHRKFFLFLRMRMGFEGFPQLGQEERPVLARGFRSLFGMTSHMYVRVY